MRNGLRWCGSVSSSTTAVCAPGHRQTPGQEGLDQQALGDAARPLLPRLRHLPERRDPRTARTVDRRRPLRPSLAETSTNPSGSCTPSNRNSTQPKTRATLHPHDQSPRTAKRPPAKRVAPPRLPASRSCSRAFNQALVLVIPLRWRLGELTRTPRRP